MEWLAIGGPALGLAGVVFAAYMGWRGKRRETDVAETNAQQAAIAARWDDASELAKYIREEVERQVAPIKAELQRVKDESHEMHDAVRARETQLWLWDQRGRPGDLPMLPAPILKRLGLGYFVEEPENNN
ncbi:hypothetical protein QWJ90_01235 [Microbacterium oryzae]|uniref:hypothetical protein n=1 Tax=Microbacterium oryzae TaxID=743009 RepID=UPI0025B02A14|nr:hypothetical protein [Microbacterium oryzae]MDN3309545.1 hypothetical protein [Microbacterium oryzae]